LRCPRRTSARTRDQFGQFERFGDIIIPARIQTGYDIIGLAARGQEQNGHIVITRVGADFAAHTQAIEAGHHDVQNNQVGLPLVERPYGFGPRCSAAYIEPFALQGTGQRAQHLGIIVNGQNVGSDAHD
jgi:hypothetical protein